MKCENEVWTETEKQTFIICIIINMNQNARITCVTYRANDEKKRTRNTNEQRRLWMKSTGARTHNKYSWICSNWTSSENYPVCSNRIENSSDDSSFAREPTEHYACSKNMSQTFRCRFSNTYSHLFKLFSSFIRSVTYIEWMMLVLASCAKHSNAPYVLQPPNIITSNMSHFMILFSFFPRIFFLSLSLSRISAAAAGDHQQK